MDNEDPVAQFFPGQDSVDLYAVLSLTSAATLDQIKKSYRRLALIYHPDKQVTASEREKADASTKFQQIGFSYAVLSDENRKQRYDRTGKTDEGFEFTGDDGWEAYFEEMFDRVTREKLDGMKSEYQGSQEEVDDIKNAYAETAGSIGEIMNRIQHSTHEDESRFIVLISHLISKGELPALPAWELSVKDKKSKLVREKHGQKEAEEAEALAKELGVWDEFYGDGKTGGRKGKGKGKKGEEEDHSTLSALILKKRKNVDSFFDSLAERYAEPGSKSEAGKGKRKMKGDDSERDTVDGIQKKSRRAQATASSPPEIDDAEFEEIQRKLMRFSGDTGSKGKRGRRAK